MSDALKKVKAGDSLRIPAATFNAFVDAARAHRERQRDSGQRPKAAQQHSGIVLIRNTTGVDLTRMLTVALGESVVGPADNEDEWLRRPAFDAATPSESGAGRCAVMLEPAAQGAMGLAMAAGIAPCYVFVHDAAHRYARPYPPNYVFQSSEDAADAQIVWKEAGTGLLRAVVRLGNDPDVELPLPVANPAVLAASGEAANTDAWGIFDPPAGTDGVRWTAVRLHWSGVSGEPVYQYVRTPTHDANGRLVAVSPEARSVAFDTGPCEQP